MRVNCQHHKGLRMLQIGKIFITPIYVIQSNLLEVNRKESNRSQKMCTKTRIVKSGKTQTLGLE